MKPGDKVKIKREYQNGSVYRETTGTLIRKNPTKDHAHDWLVRFTKGIQESFAPHEFELLPAPDTFTLLTCLRRALLLRIEVELAIEEDRAKEGLHLIRPTKQELYEALTNAHDKNLKKVWVHYE